MTTRFVKAGGALAAGLLLLLASGCGSAPGEGYQTLSTEQAEQIEQARRERARAAADDAPDEAADATLAHNGEVASTAGVSAASSLVLTAARTAAAAARPDETQPAGTAAAAADPWARSPTDRSAQETAQEETAPVAAAASAAGLPADTPVEAAARLAARAVNVEPIVRTIQLLIPEQSFSIEGPDDAIRISFDDFDLLKVLNMEPVPVNAVDHFPDWLADLDGRRVRVRGFMYPTFQETDIPGFVLARDNQICCFGRNPKIYDLVEITLRPGVTTDYIQGRPFDVVGIFHISPEADGDELWQLYQMTDAIVIDE